MRHPLSARWLLMVLLPLAVAGGISRPGLAAEPATQPAARQLLAEADRIVVLGDSITYGGRWVALLDCWKETAGLTGMVIDMGLSSETVSGLSEDGHAGGTFPRPDLHEQLHHVYLEEGMVDDGFPLDLGQGGLQQQGFLELMLPHMVDRGLD